MPTIIGLCKVPEAVRAVAVIKVLDLSVRLSYNTTNIVAKELATCT